MTNVHGYKWIRVEKRYRIYERDGFKCLWCQRDVKPKLKNQPNCATLDHFLPRENGGGNMATNVFTSCLQCNSSRQSVAALAFAKKPFTSLDRIIEHLDKPLPKKREPWEYDERLTGKKWKP